MKHRILLIDDDKINLLATKKLLEIAGYRVTTSSSGEQGIELLNMECNDFSLVLLDLHMPGLSGVETAQKIYEILPKQMVAAYSVDLERETLKQAMEAGMTSFVEKKLRPAEIIAKVEALLKKYESTLMPILKSSIDNDKYGMIGESKAIQKIIAEIPVYGQQDASVLIQGETGTGKEVVARALHRESGRPGPFVAVNCSAIPSELMESTLFGHRRGSFTSATSDSKGLFREANGGTLFLDEIGDLPLGLQAKILRAIQERSVRPVGDGREWPVDLRIVAATHQNLSAMVESGQFRQDLFFRLNVLTMNLPPLRERQGDLGLLISHFCKSFGQRTGKSISFASETLRVLESYAWPGNVRELENIVERHLVLAAGSLILRTDLDPKLSAKNKIGPSHFETISDLTMKHEKETVGLVVRILKNTKNKSAASRKLGVSPSRLHAIMDRYGIVGLERQ